MASLPNQWIISVYSQVLLYSGNNKGKRIHLFKKKHQFFIKESIIEKLLNHIWFKH